MFRIAENSFQFPCAYTYRSRELKLATNYTHVSLEWKRFITSVIHSSVRTTNVAANSFVFRNHEKFLTLEYKCRQRKRENKRMRTQRPLFFFLSLCKRKIETFQSAAYFEDKYCQLFAHASPHPSDSES